MLKRKLSCLDRFSSQLILKALYEAAQADAQHLTNIPQLYQIQSAQPAFYVADKRLWAVKRFGEVALCQPRLDPALFEQFQENEVLVSIDRFFHRRRFRPLTGQVRYI
ncbi:hypothetical protein F469_00491 [Pseudomonas sp. URMO17WK12:I2]|nr:hypothetical protein F469_00491 [Pseudomonas sp. URMO17WK12:I2]